MEEFQDDEHEIIEEEKEDSDEDLGKDGVQGKSGKSSDRCNTEQNAPNEADDPLLPTFAPEGS